MIWLKNPVCVDFDGVKNSNLPGNAPHILYIDILVSVCILSSYTGFREIGQHTDMNTF